jgi:hypothetical protein
VGEELLLGPREAIQLESMVEGDLENEANECEDQDQDDSKTGSGIDETDDEDEDGGVKCIKCDKTFHDIFM